jgi:hypothetical protein
MTSNRPIANCRTESERRASFAQINAIWRSKIRYECGGSKQKERLIRVELTHEQAIVELKRQYRNSSLCDRKERLKLKDFCRSFEVIRFTDLRGSRAFALSLNRLPNKKLVRE